MRRRACLLLLPALCLAAFEPLPQPVGRVTVGSYLDRFSDSTGTWKGTFVAADWYRDPFGPWSGLLARSDRPEGTATTFRLAKEHGFDELSWVWGGLSLASGADFLPRFRVDLDSNLGLAAGWGLALGGAWSRFQDGATTTLVQAGPSWSREEWSASLRGQRLDYGGDAASAASAELRWGRSSLQRWHSMRYSWGRGVLDTLQPGGSNAGFGFGTTDRGRGRGRGPALAVDQGLPGGAPLPQERLLTCAHHVPLHRHLALKLEAGWGTREGQFIVWSGSLQAAVTF